MARDFEKLEIENIENGSYCTGRDEMGCSRSAHSRKNADRHGFVPIKDKRWHCARFPPHSKNG